MNLEMPPQIPRVEFSILSHNYPLMNRVTGIEVDADSPEGRLLEARRAFVKKRDFSLMFNALINSTIFGEKQSHMGHASYAENGADLDRQTDQLVATPEEALAFDFYGTYGEIESVLENSVGKTG